MSMAAAYVRVFGTATGSSAEIAATRIVPLVGSTEYARPTGSEHRGISNSVGMNLITRPPCMWIDRRRPSFGIASTTFSHLCLGPVQETLQPNGRPCLFASVHSLSSLFRSTEPTIWAYRAL